MLKREHTRAYRSAVSALELRSRLRRAGGRGRRRSNLKAAIALALSFETHRTLTREQHLTDEQAIELMARLVECA